MTKLYGIKNCDTMKKAMNWLADNGVAYEFIDYKKTILSQNTNDVNRDRAFNLLRAKFPTWEEVRDAKTKDVIEAIRPAGLANQKGPRISAGVEIYHRRTRQFGFIVSQKNVCG